VSYCGVLLSPGRSGEHMAFLNQRGILPVGKVEKCGSGCGAVQTSMEEADHPTERHPSLW